MSLILPDGFPVIEDLCNEGIARELLCGKAENTSRTLRILIVNLMPVKRDAERDFLRLLAHSPYDMIVDFLRMKSHISKNTPMKHVETFYKDFDRIAADEYDGMILTGAPVEHLPFEQVDYWKELCQVMDWATNHVRSTLCVCWGLGSTGCLVPLLWDKQTCFYGENVWGVSPYFTCTRVKNRMGV